MCENTSTAGGDGAGAGMEEDEMAGVESNKWVIAMAGALGVYFLRENLTWGFDESEARFFDTLGDANTAYLAAAKKGRRGHFVNAGVQRATV